MAFAIGHFGSRLHALFIACVVLVLVGPVYLLACTITHASVFLKTFAKARIGRAIINRGILAGLSLGLCVALVPVYANAQEAVANASVNLRAGPGTSYSVIATIPEGARVSISGCTEGNRYRWCGVNYRGTEGYAAGRYLTVLSQTSGEAAAQTTDEAAPLELTEDEKLSNEELEQLVAPIALHPDSLLSQILMASTYPLEVVEADRWVKANPDVKDDALETAMVDKDWDASIKALTAFPSVLEMMNAELSWTQQLGDAFLAQQEDVLAAVQVLRQRANKEGNLESNENIVYEEQEVTTESGSTTTVIVAEPTNTEVVYVPTYNPTVVYGTWPYPSYPPYYYYPPGYVARGLFWFGVGYAIGNNWWGGCNWGSNKVNININNYNKNRYNKRKRDNPNWRHNPKHRKGAPYRNRKVADRYGGRKRDQKARAREKYRGRADAGRRDLAKQPRRKKPDQALRKQKRQSAARKGPNRKKAAPRKRTAKKQPTRRKSQAKRQPKKSTRRSAYRGAGSGRNAKRYSNRGYRSRSGNRSRARPRRSGGGRRGGGGRGGGRRR